MRWTIKPKPAQEEVAQLAQELNVDPLIATLLIQRNITSFDKAKAFFRPSLDHLHDPFLMKDMDVAVNRIEQAMANQENILVFGDYDVDGTTAVSLVSSYLKSIYPNIATYIPDRYAEGYGISFQGIDFAEDNGFSLIIALDCGIKSIDHVAYAKEKKIDFIICDHHRPGDSLPDAVAVLDPKRDDCKYPYDELCGCGVGFKVMSALAEQLNLENQTYLEFLDLVAIAIAADIVSMTGENRVLAYHGLKKINADPSTGIRSLLKLAGAPETLTIHHVVFLIAPRINAAGRMDDAKKAVLLFAEKDENTAQEMAEAVTELLSEILVRNEVSLDGLVSIFFTATPDLHSAFPAAAARGIGLADVPLMCAQELDIAGAMEKVIRVMLHVQTDTPRSEIKHVYLRGAEALRKDIAQ